jgi:hypothetical protein
MPELTLSPQSWIYEFGFRTRGEGRGETQEKEEERFYSPPDDEDEFISKVSGIKENTRRAVLRIRDVYPGS